MMTATTRCERENHCEHNVFNMTSSAIHTGQDRAIQLCLSDALAAHLEAAAVAVAERALGPERTSVLLTIDVHPVLPFFSND